MEDVIDKKRLVKWLKEEEYGCNVRGEEERSNTCKDIILKIEN